VSGLRLLIRQITAFLPFRNPDLVVPRYACETALPNEAYRLSLPLELRTVIDPRAAGCAANQTCKFAAAQRSVTSDERKLGQGSSEAPHGLPPKRDVQPVHVVPCLST